LVVIGLWASRLWWLPPTGKFLSDADPLRQTDAVYVLGGGADTRPFVAAALVKAGLADRVLLPSVQIRDKDLEFGFLPDHEVMRRVLIARGVDPNKISILPGVCDSTDKEAQSLARFLDSNPNMVIGVVTSDFHTRRARILFRRHLGERMQRVVFVAAPCDECSPETWWRSEWGFDTYLMEYTKLLTTWMR
jgi:uncharacterized SAM-binding protein YcdF (DUF218 family)